jgi:hypothetical protein
MERFMPRRLAAAGAEAALAAHARGEVVVGLDRVQRGERNDQELRDPISRVDREALLAVGVEQ